MGVDDRRELGTRVNKMYYIYVWNYQRTNSFYQTYPRKNIQMGTVKCGHFNFFFVYSNAFFFKISMMIIER